MQINKQSLRYLIIALAILLLLSLGYMLVAKRPLSVEIVNVEHNVPIKVFGLGTVEARVTSKVGFNVKGILTTLPADHGDRVKAGSVLASLHNTEQQAHVTKAKANVMQTESLLQKSKASLERSRAILKQRQLTNRRQQTLVKQKTVSREVADEAQMNETVATADIVVAESEVAVAQSAQQNARAQLSLEKTILDHYTLYAPYDALVVARHKELGTVVNPGEPVFTLVDPDTVWALAYVDEARAGDLQVGQPVEVRLRSTPNKPLQAHIERIGIESDRVSEERKVFVKCNQCPADFHLGEQVEVFITVATLPKALLVPETAVDLYNGSEGIVWVVDDGVLQRRKVRFGYQTLDGRLEIIDEIEQNARVVASWPPGLREGRSARIHGGDNEQ